jgi:hypothetical protein
VPLEFETDDDFETVGSTRKLKLGLFAGVEDENPLKFPNGVF